MQGPKPHGVGPFTNKRCTCSVVHPMGKHARRHSICAVQYCYHQMRCMVINRKHVIAYAGVSALSSCPPAQSNCARAQIAHVRSFPPWQRRPLLSAAVFTPRSEHVQVQPAALVCAAACAHTLVLAPVVPLHPIHPTNSNEHQPRRKTTCC